MNDLLTSILGGDYLNYKYDKDKGTSVTEEISSNLLKYDHTSWEDEQHQELGDSRTADLLRGDQSTNQPSPIKSPIKKKLKPNSATNRKSTPARRKIPTTQLCEALKQSKTRLELASISSMAPPVHPSTAVTVIQGDFVVSDPFNLSSRPCSSLLEDAFHEMRNNNASGVCIHGIGNFTQDGLHTLQKFCNISEIKKKVTEEEIWLGKCSLSNKNLIMIQNSLWHKESNDILMRSTRMKNKFIDVSSFSYLVGERYVDNFTIDVLIGNTSEIAGNTTLYLPTEFLTWMEADDLEFKTKKNTCIYIHRCRYRKPFTDPLRCTYG